MALIQAPAAFAGRLGRLAARVSRVLLRGLLALCTVSEHRRAIAQLQSLTDLQLKDIGLTRAQIEPAVRGTRRHDAA